MNYDSAKMLYDIAMSNMTLPIEWVKETCQLLHKYHFDRFANEIEERWK